MNVLTVQIFKIIFIILSLFSKLSSKKDIFGDHLFISHFTMKRDIYKTNKFLNEFIMNLVLLYLLKSVWAGPYT